MTETGTRTRKERAADTQSRECGGWGGEAELLVWNGLVAKAERAAAACIPELDPDDHAERHSRDALAIRGRDLAAADRKRERRR